ncbi:MAG: hypothetical protein R3E54_11585 [Halioglobus sp.]
MLRVFSTASVPLRAFALLALLAVFGTQLLEVSHSHGTQEASAHCLLCKGSADTALPTAAPGIAPFALADAVAVFAARGAASAPTYRQPARGPPLNT